MSASAIPMFESFGHPNEDPREHFYSTPCSSRNHIRFVHRSDPNTFLIYTDGACTDNGQYGAKGGWGFVFRDPEPGGWEGVVSCRLEDKGPSGQFYNQTSNRAELRAVIGALQYLPWYCEGWTKLVIATDSEYVVKGITDWIQTWWRNGWRTTQGGAVQNQDLWMKLISEIDEHRQMGMDVCFWRIPQSLNREADNAAKAGTQLSSVSSFEAIRGN
jgi:ribonuclease HI